VLLGHNVGGHDFVRSAAFFSLYFSDVPIFRNFLVRGRQSLVWHGALTRN